MNTKLIDENNADHIRWQPIVAKYAKPDLVRSLWQLANSVIPYFLLWVLMIRSLQISYWLTLALAFPAAGFLMRTFIIFHDCGHGSFFKSQKANEFVGRITAFLHFTPYYRWKHDHAVHHATAGDLDRRGVGDVYTMTVREYLAASWLKKAAYRVMRNPLILLGFTPLIVFLIGHRIPPSRGKRLVDEYYAGGCDCSYLLGDRMEDLSTHTTSDSGGQLHDWGLAFLRPAQF
jgi:omega-6 fatty acid desaturase (delta-12 desaturase)